MGIFRNLHASAFSISAVKLPLLTIIPTHWVLRIELHVHLYMQHQARNYTTQGAKLYDAVMNTSVVLG